MRHVKKKFNRTEMLFLLEQMAREFERRAADGTVADQGADAAVLFRDRRGYAELCVARHLRELLSIAEGRRVATYWTRHLTKHRHDEGRHDEGRHHDRWGSWVKKIFWGRQVDGIAY